MPGVSGSYTRAAQLPVDQKWSSFKQQASDGINGLRRAKKNQLDYVGNVLLFSGQIMKVTQSTWP